MNNFLQLILVVLCIRLIRNFELDDSSPCAGKHTTSEPVIKFCQEIEGTLIFRCCRGADNKTFYAIDLMDANLTEIPTFRNDLNLNLSVIDLRNNADLESSLHDDAFLTLTSLNELLLPPQVPCPGGSQIWEQITNTSDPPGFHCINQISICVNSTNLCDEPGAICVSNGPNNFLCQCKSGYHDYKCLRYGTFPFGAFFGPTLGVTILVSALLYWTQRRHVKKIV